MHEGVNPDKETGAILTPIVQSTTFVQDSVETYLVRTNGPSPVALMVPSALPQGMIYNTVRSYYHVLPVALPCSKYNNLHDVAFVLV